MEEFNLDDLENSEDFKMAEQYMDQYFERHLNDSIHFLEMQLADYVGFCLSCRTLDDIPFSGIITCIKKDNVFICDINNNRYAIPLDEISFFTIHSNIKSKAKRK